MKRIRVAAAVILRIHDGKKEVLAAQRSHGEYEGLWEFPGGKIEEGETAQEALVREIREELAIEIEAGTLIAAIEYDYPGFHLSMECFSAQIKSSSPVCLEHKELRWISDCELNSISWLPADKEAVSAARKLLQG